MVQSKHRRCGVLTLLVALAYPGAVDAQDPLPSWNDGPAKRAIVEFVKSTTTAGSPQFVAPAERIATFDEDGTTWVEHPMYTEVVFSLDRVAELAPQHPEWKDVAPFNVVIAHDKAALEKLTLQDLMKIVVVTHTGVSSEEFDKAANDWLAKARRSPLASAVHGAGLSADARGYARILRERVQNVYRDGRHAAVRASFRREDVRHRAGTNHWDDGHHHVRSEEAEE